MLIHYSHLQTSYIHERLLTTKQNSQWSRKGGQKGANVLLDHVLLKVKQKPEDLYKILEEMEREENLRHFAEKIKGEIYNGKLRSE